MDRAVAGPGDRHASILERLAQRLQRVARELGELVEEQHAMICEHGLADAIGTGAADEARRAGRVVRSAQRTLACEAARGDSGDAVNPRHIDRLGSAQRRQDRADPLREHRLADPRRSAEQAVVAARCSREERADGVILSAHVAQVDPAVLSRAGSLRGGGWGEAIADLAADDSRGAL